MVLDELASEDLELQRSFGPERLLEFRERLETQDGRGGPSTGLRAGSAGDSAADAAAK